MYSNVQGVSLCKSGRGLVVTWMSAWRRCSRQDVAVHSMIYPRVMTMMLSRRVPLGILHASLPLSPQPTVQRAPYRSLYAPTNSTTHGQIIGGMKMPLHWSRRASCVVISPSSSFSSSNALRSSSTSVNFVVRDSQ